ncbi:hypothetical protein F4774DRAFT_405556 [Daldinia eschscholtzii]|nr:hypothetical protein F4774DRAFT_405556 [Daldinia eschscholtzii]
MLGVTKRLAASTSWLDRATAMRGPRWSKITLDAVRLNSSNPTTPIKSSRNIDSFYGSGLDVTFISPVLHVEEKSRNDHFIKYGNHIVIFSLGARSDYVETTFNLLDYVGPVSILINAHMWAHGTCPYEKNDIVQVSGSLGPWSFRAARPNVVTGQESWQAIITTSTPNMIKLPLLHLSDPEAFAVQTQGFHCSFYGRLCATPDNDRLKLSKKNIAPFAQQGF